MFKNIKQSASKAKSEKAVEVTIISPDSFMKGDFSARGEFDISGRLEGGLNASVVIIREGGVFQGKMKTKKLVVKGKVIAGIEADSIVIMKGGSVEGDLVYKSLIVEEGGIIFGSCQPASKSPSFSENDISLKDKSNIDEILLHKNPNSMDHQKSDKNQRKVA